MFIDRRGCKWTSITHYAVWHTRARALWCVGWLGGEIAWYGRKWRPMRRFGMWIDRAAACADVAYVEGLQAARETWRKMYPHWSAS